MKAKVWTFVVGVVLAPLVLWGIDAWSGYYGSIAESRFSGYFMDGAWRSPAAQLNNARIGILVEFALPCIMMIFFYFIIVAVVHAALKKTPRPDPEIRHNRQQSA